MSSNTKSIDPITEVTKVRNYIHTARLLVEEHGEKTVIMWNLNRAIKSLDLVQRWFMRNPDVLLNDIFHSAEH